MFRAPRAAVQFGDVALAWYANQGDKPLASPRGQLYDHIALSVTDLDAWVAKLKGEGVTFLEQPYKLGDTRAAMIEGPSREALELVEVR
jgi:catechol 2,3-dioxygenase-like lactoylglutathione lyase family enzyme